MYTKSDRVFWHSISCPITWCFAICVSPKNHILTNFSKRQSKASVLLVFSSYVTLQSKLIKPHERPWKTVRESDVRSYEYFCVWPSVWKDVMWLIDAGSWEGESSWEGTTNPSQRLWVAFFVANVSILGFDRYLSKSSLLHNCFLLPGLRASRLTWDQPFCLEHLLPIVSLTWTSPRVPLYRVLSGTTSSTSSGFSSMSSACFSPCITCTSFTKTSAALTSRPSGWPA